METIMDIEKTLKEMTLEEKASLCAGSDSWHTKPIERLGIPPVMMADGPHGLRKEVSEDTSDILRDSYPATCFPTASALASTWNRELVGMVGEAIAEECLAEGVSVVLGPGANIKRSPLCGRNFEYFSEDPYMTGEMAAAFIQAVQGMGVGASLKHFAANNQEYRRMLIDAVVDERALREIYLAGFETAVKKAKPWTVMAAYNRLNGMYCTENERMLKDVLRDEWEFEGIVVSDWGAVNDRVLGVAAGLDLEMPGIQNGNEELIRAAVVTGLLMQSALDAVNRRMLEFIDRCIHNKKDGFNFDQDAHHQLATQAAAEGAVLLKNDSDLLPLAKDATIALIGQFAKKPRYQGSGSSLINPGRLDNLYDAMCAYAGQEKIMYADGYPLEGQGDAERLLAQAIETARNVDVAVICAGLTDMDEVESIDRQHLRLPETHNRLIEAVAATNPNTVVLLSNGAPVEMPWIIQVPAILEGYLGGQAGASAHCQLLYGEENPSGKLAETFPLSLQDTPNFLNFPGGPKTVEYRESIYVGYRFYDSADKAVLFPFGHGLSYTRFAYQSLEIKHLEDGDVRVQFDVKNIGNRTGKEIAQVYIHPLDSRAFRPEQELKGFEKIMLDPGAKKTVEIVLDARAFSYFSTQKSDWVTAEGEYEIRVSASSRDTRLTEKITIKGEAKEAEAKQIAYYSQFLQDTSMPAAAFADLLGRPLPDNDPDPRPYTLNTPVMDMQKSLVGRLLRRIIRKQIDKMINKDIHGPTRLMIEQMALESPLRVLMMFSGGALNRRMLDSLLMLANRKILKQMVQIPRVRENKRPS
jgi:beta-glucosidase